MLYQFYKQLKEFNYDDIILLLSLILFLSYVIKVFRINKKIFEIICLISVILYALIVFIVFFIVQDSNFLESLFRISTFIITILILYIYGPKKIKDAIENFLFAETDESNWYKILKMIVFLSATIVMILKKYFLINIKAN